jgi:carbon storage regulator
MLVLTRKMNERIVIGGNVEVVVLSVSGNRVRLGITAPMETTVTRGEICDPLLQPCVPDQGQTVGGASSFNSIRGIVSSGPCDSRSEFGKITDCQSQISDRSFGHVLFGCES